MRVAFDGFSLRSASRARRASSTCAPAPAASPAASGRSRARLAASAAAGHARAPRVASLAGPSPSLARRATTRTRTSSPTAHGSTNGFVRRQVTATRRTPLSKRGPRGDRRVLVGEVQRARSPTAVDPGARSAACRCPIRSAGCARAWGRSSTRRRAGRRPRRRASRRAVAARIEVVVARAAAQAVGSVVGRREARVELVGVRDDVAEQVVVAAAPADAVVSGVAFEHVAPASPSRRSGPSPPVAFSMSPSRSRSPPAPIASPAARSTRTPDARAT